MQISSYTSMFHTKSRFKNCKPALKLLDTSNYITNNLWDCNKNQQLCNQLPLYCKLLQFNYFLLLQFSTGWIWLDLGNTCWLLYWKRLPANLFYYRNVGCYFHFLAAFLLILLGTGEDISVYIFLRLTAVSGALLLLENYCPLGTLLDLSFLYFFLVG